MDYITGKVCEMTATKLGRYCEGIITVETAEGKKKKVRLSHEKYIMAASAHVDGYTIRITVNNLDSKIAEGSQVEVLMK